MLIKKYIFIIVLLTVSFLITPAFSSEIHGWIKSKTCWVVKTPSTDATIVGLIIYKAACTVEDARGEWYKIVFAPVRNPTTGKFLDRHGEGYFIQKSTFTTVPPYKW